ncbi:MAG: PEP-CTERM sorting domain-containing protein [Planctomycetes bacterium]|nr:PEP-CTERM sorting domain-containing protein [Planctomycetota bacterium]
MDAAGNLVNAQRAAGNMAGTYHGPGGATGLEWEGTTLEPEAVIPNQPMPEPWYKEVFLLVDYVDQNVLAAFPNIANIKLKVGNNLYNPTVPVAWDDDGGQALFYWKLDAEDGQPGWESIVFPDPSYKNLFDISTGAGGPVKDWNVATICVPEPATLMLLAAGAGLALLRRRRTAA